MEILFRGSHDCLELLSRCESERCPGSDIEEEKASRGSISGTEEEEEEHTTLGSIKVTEEYKRRGRILGYWGYGCHVLVLQGSTGDQGRASQDGRSTEQSRTCCTAEDGSF